MSSNDNRTLATAVSVALVVWASAWVGVRDAVRYYSPAHVALLRYLCASLALGLVLRPHRLRLPPRRDLPAFLVMGLLAFTIYNLCINYGEQQVTAGAASFVINASPVFTAILGALFLGERLLPAGYAGMALSFSGVALIALAEGGGLTLNRGALLILVAALSSSIYNVMQRKYLTRYAPLELTTYAIWAGTLCLLVFSGGLMTEIEHAPTRATLEVIYLGLFPGAIGYVAWSRVLSLRPASFAGGYLYTMPPITLLMSWLWLGEVPRVLSIVGGAVSLGGVFVLNKWGRQPALPDADSAGSVPVWAEGYFEQTYGICADDPIQRTSQGEYPRRKAIE